MYYLQQTWFRFIVSWMARIASNLKNVGFWFVGDDLTVALHVL